MPSGIWGRQGVTGIGLIGVIGLYGDIGFSDLGFMVRVSQNFRGIFKGMIALCGNVFSWLLFPSRQSRPKVQNCTNWV